MEQKKALKLQKLPSRPLKTKKPYGTLVKQKKREIEALKAIEEAEKQKQIAENEHRRRL